MAILHQSDYGIWLADKDIVTFTKPTEEILSQRKLETLQRVADIKAWGLKNPVKFMELMFGVELLDYQAYAVQASWNKSHALWLFSRNGGKSMLLGLYDMTRAMLLDNSRIFICAGTSNQSIDTFTKIEDMAKKNITSMPGLTDVFLHEVISNMKNSDGFIHNPAGFTFSLFNNSFVKTLSSNINALRGKRATLVNFDETGFLPEEIFAVVEPYVAQNVEFISGPGIDPTTMPPAMPLQLLYASSASSIDTPFYKKYREYSKRMIYGDPNYFVCDLNCDVIMSATKWGQPFTPLLSQDKVDAAMADNKEKALREYHNRFSVDAGANAIVKRGVVARNSYSYSPIMCNDPKNKKIFLMAYDPARSYDNSFVLIAELFWDDEKGWKLRIANGANFMDVNKKKKTPLRTPEQIKRLKQLILDYNGEDSRDYDNIEGLYIDAGSGGGGVNIADFFMEDWYEQGHEGEEAYKHKGMIDKEYSKDYVKNFPYAENIIHLMDPVTYRSTMFEALQEMTTQDLIEFPNDYDNKGYLNTLHIDQEKYLASKQKLEEKYAKTDLEPNEIELKIKQDMENEDIGTIERDILTPEEEVALTQIDAMKTEAYCMVRIPRPNSRKDDFQLIPEKKNTMHDDRTYTLAMLAYALQEKRRQGLKKGKKKQIENVADILPMRRGKIDRTIG